MITGRQIRAARALLGWDAKDLAAKAKINTTTIFNIEKGIVQARGGSMEKIARVFDENEIEFTENQGVRFRLSDIEVFQGPDRFNEFTDFLFEHLKVRGGDVCISARDERFFAKYRKDHELHRKRMKELVDQGNVTFRILATESTFVSAYAQHRWQPSTNSVPTSFYAFGDCLALISFTHQPPPYVVLLKSGPFAEAYRESFNIAWANAKEPPISGRNST